MSDLNDALLDRYDYADPALERLHAWDKVYIGAILSYGRGISHFGRQMMAHQNRVARDGAAFLRYLGYSDRAAKNFRAAMLFHDIGKTHTSYNPALWTLDERPLPSEKAWQRMHARLGAEMLATIAQKIPGFSEHPHYLVRHAVTLYHHERLDRAGPEKINAATLPLFVQAACIIDSYDGDRIQRPHQDHRRTPREALQRMAGQHKHDKKYHGAFDKTLLSKYIAFKEQELDGPQP